MKTHERWERIEELYHAALEREASERDEFLLNACASDAEMLEEVRSLIVAHYREGSFIDMPAYEAAAEMFAESDALIPAGQSIAHYRVLELLGRGGMGEVYLAQDTRLSRKVALKMLPERFTDNRERLTRFIREAKAASALNHPNIMTVYEIGESAGAHYIASEFIDGQTLRKRAAHERMRIGEAIDVAAQAASALSAAHAAGIIHRDIKPENIMVRADGYVKVLDFGLAKLTEKSKDSDSSPLDSQAGTRIKTDTEPGRVLGTINYMSPEQARGLTVDGRTDTFSLGVVLYEMVAGRRPFEGATDMDVIVSILDKEPPLVSSCGVDAPAELQRIINKALCKNRDERYQTIKDLWIDLKNLKEEMAFEAKLERSASVEADNKESGAPGAGESQTAINGRKRAAIIAVAAVALILAVAIMAAISWPRMGLKPESSTPAVTTPAPETVLNYRMVLQEHDNGKYKSPVTLPGEVLFNDKDRIRFIISSPQPGYLYIVNEGPSESGQTPPLVLLFPSPTANGGLARLPENEEVQIPEEVKGVKDKGWFEFDRERGTEKIWIVWSADAVREIEAVKRFVNAEDRGSINDTTLNNTVKEFLARHSSLKPVAEKIEKETIVKATGNMLVHLIRLDHR